MSTVELKCPVPDCSYKTDKVSEIVAVALLTAHTTTHQSSAQSSVQHSPKPERPAIDIGITAEEWKLFERRWRIFATSTNISGNHAATQLFQCASTRLGDAVLRVNDDITRQTEQEMLKLMKSLAVIPVALMVVRSELLSLRQAADEAFRSFFARVRGKAEICSFTTESKCGCGTTNVVDFTEIMVRDVIIAGIYDEDIRRRLMSVNDLCKKSSNQIISLVEAEEMARNATSNSTVATTIGNTTTPKTPTPPITDLKKDKASCPQCSKAYFKYKKGRYGWNKKPHQVCTDCYRSNKTIKPQVKENDTSNAVLGGDVTSISHFTDSCDVNKPVQQKACNIAPIQISHHIFSKGEWKKARFADHPYANITMSVDQAHYKSFGVKPPDVNEMVVNCIADTGAQSNLWSLKQCKEMGFTDADLIPVTSALSAANKSRIELNGAILLDMSGVAPDGSEITCSAMVYVSDSVNTFYLSYNTMVDLGILASSFPAVGDAFMGPHLNAGVDAQFPSTSSPGCSCPERKPIPPRPSHLPFECTTENIDSMREWLLDQFSASTFNTCPHQPLPEMKGPPIEMHLDPSATPRVCHTPANVPVHWQNQVKADLERDVHLGVIERVPYGDPVSWCHRMVVTRKHDGTPRRTVDLSPLNKFFKRETLAMESPFHLACKVPGNTWKTVTDAWNGYHSVPL